MICKSKQPFRAVTVITRTGLKVIALIVDDEESRKKQILPRLAELYGIVGEIDPRLPRMSVDFSEVSAEEFEEIVKLEAHRSMVAI